MSDTQLGEFAAALDEAALTRTTLASGSSGLTGTEDAYAVQEALVARQLERGARLSGFKLGFTSTAKMRQMGVHDLIHGRITDRMRIADGGTFDAGTLIHPRVEPEVAFLLGGPLGPDTVAPLTAVAAVAPALEVIDSRYDGFTFSLPEVIADNTSAAGYVLGPWRKPVELADRGVLLEIDGRLVEAGSTAAILGHPLRALAAAARLAPRGVLDAGTVILAGAATAAAPLPHGVHVRATVSGLGTVGFSTVPKESQQ
ncbi:4-oxalocrotonate decarboxylase [Streptomyces spiroverticillatus]|uniref:4-oxalocrotonate decarboxylase n=1 Tax=Streptomyces finlayi TaxID=67296 RepID=A0A918WV62_9ACTN|nr:fumarylacetoacetate hydrolase family protein [Streptomyces finlayi]GHA02129.1 4-oxalocrotonate decarboxylase [Streptomyces spiroverticillatus]GHC86370.1 4-oxalocrotonate decarboxylase [Streptomyces finlayi]